MKQIIKTLQKKSMGRYLFACVFALVVCDVPKSGIAAVNCSQAPNGLKSTSDFGVMYVNSDSCTHFFKLDSGGDYTFNTGGLCDSHNRCRVGYNCTDGYYFANRCGSDCFHAELTQCGSGVTYSKIGNNRNCSDFAFGPAIYDSSNNLKKDLKSDSWTFFGNQTYSASQIGGTATYNVKQGDAERTLYAWTTSCSFPGRGSSSNPNIERNDDGWHCKKGYIDAWNSESKSAGNAGLGFYVKFITDDSHPCYNCTECQTGWKFSSTTACQKKCNTCNDNGGWTSCNSSCTCKKGTYQVNSSDTSCTLRDRFEECTVSSGTCKCRQGFDLNCSGSCSQNCTCGGDDGKQCRPNFRYVEPGASDNPYMQGDNPDPNKAACVCDTQYFNLSGIGEDAECILKTNEGGTRYMDRAGEFYLSNDYFHNNSHAGCRFDNRNGSNYPYMSEDRPSDQCSLHNSQDSSSDRCYMNNWWIGLDWSSPQQQ